MRFIREMIARKAAGDEHEAQDFESDADAMGQPDAHGTTDSPLGEVAGFEDEIGASPVHDDAPAAYANDVDPVVAEGQDGYDEEAELDALDAAFPDLEPEDEVAQADDEAIDRLFPEEEAQAPDEGMFEDIPEAQNDDPMPELTAADIERAMKNRKKIWHSVPDEDEDPLAPPEGVSGAVTRPIRRITAELNMRPVSVPFELSQADAVPADEVEAEMSVEDFEASEELQAEQSEATQSDGPVEDIDEPVMDDMDEDDVDEMLEPEYEEPASEDGPVDEDFVAQAPQLADEMEPVLDEDEADDEVLWPQQPAAQAPVEPVEVEVAEEPAAEPEPVEDDGPDIQALMARAALEAAETSYQAGPSVVPEEGSEEAAAVDNRPVRRAGRVKTRLLGFQPEAAEQDIFERSSGAAQSAKPDMFPVGWIVVADGPGRGASYSLHNGVSLMGRGDDQAICLDFGDNSISRNNHASIAFDDESNQFFLGHGGKSNIVRLNNRPVLSTEDLSHGDEIRIGETTLRFTALCGENFNWTDNAEDDNSNAAAE